MGYYLARLVLWFGGWQVSAQISETNKKAVMIAAPHTSNWDLVWARAAFYILGIPVRFTVKKELLKGPLRWILNTLGAIGIDRSQHDGKRQSMTEAMIQLFNEREELVILVTPEGTRSYQPEWKTGFYRVAEGAGVPILLGYLDYENKIAGVGPTFEAKGDMTETIEKIKDFYRPIKAKFPEQGVR